jgi:hypothetical protein
LKKKIVRVYFSNIDLKVQNRKKNYGLAVGELKGTIGQVRESSLYTALQSDHSQSNTKQRTGSWQ